MVGYAPTPTDFQSVASTKLASLPIVGVERLELPNSEEKAFTVLRNCRYAIPQWRSILVTSDKRVGLSPYLTTAFN